MSKINMIPDDAFVIPPDHSMYDGDEQPVPLRTLLPSDLFRGEYGQPIHVGFVVYVMLCISPAETPKWAKGLIPMASMYTGLIYWGRPDEMVWRIHNHHQ